MKRLITIVAALALLIAIAPRVRAAEPESLVREGTEPELISTGYAFSEGPAANEQGHIYFTDIPRTRILKYDLEGEPTVFTDESGGANGLYLDHDGSLLAAQMGAGRVADFDMDGNATVIVESYEGKKFNAPNDLWLDPEGGIYFTDPRYSNANQEMDGEHVYYIKPDRETVIRVIDDLEHPNGVIGTPDGKTLYVADHGAGQTWKYSIQEDGTLTGKTLFADRGSDGMTIDERGNVYLTGEDVYVYNPAGEQIETIKIDPHPANLTFGGENNDTLFVTARMRFYAVPMAVKGAPRSN